MANPLPGGLRTERSRTGNLIGSFTLSYLVGALLLLSLVYFAGAWEVLANSRFLDFLIRVGVVKYHDKNTGFVEGVIDSKFYFQSQLPLDWLLVFVAACIFLLFWGIKTLQFHGIARFYGIKGSLGQHGRAYLYGLGINRFFPFGVGDVATVAALNGQGNSRERGTAVVFAGELFIVFEIAVFAFIGLLLMGWTPWLAQVFWSLVILGILFLWMRSSRRTSTVVSRGTWLHEAGGVVRSFAREPRVLAQLCILSLLAFALEDIAAYVIANAFGIGVNFSVLLMGVVGSYVARLIPLTPGGIGQFEWGFAAALYVGGVGAPEAATIAILDNVIRYAAGTLILGSVLLWYRVETNMRSVLALFTGAEWPATETVPDA